MKLVGLYLNILLSTTLFIFVTCQSNDKKTEQTQQKTDKEHDKPTIADVEQGIRRHIDTKTINNNGYFSFNNDTSVLNLKLVRVHTEYLSVLSSREFFACVDLATENGDVYDIDFFLKGNKDEMEITHTNLHKLNGKPYYTWMQNKDKTWITVPVEQASNKLLDVVEGQDEFTFTYEAILPEIQGSAEMWIPIAQSDLFQTIEVLSIDAPGDQKMINETNFGNTILYLRLDPEHSGERITISYHVIRLEKGPYEDDNVDFIKYLQATKQMPIGDRFGVLSAKIIDDKKADSPLSKARALYDYVIDNVRYAKQGIYGTGDSDYACDAKSGNCTEFHSLFISLARSAGIPARFAVGAGIPSSRDDGGVDGYHCWAEFYAEGKWWPVDISEADKYTALATYYFGHHPANRIEFSQGRDLAPDPMPNSGPINFLAYPVLEIEGKPDLVETKFTFNRPALNI
jgi:transglutaminase-like putative cysteine protease